MAPVAGVPKRVPCYKCGYPVFLAERLTIGKLLYHRTCLRCARCKSQLTPGSFYETEIDGVFCCETCPDEENSLTNKLRNVMDEVDNVAAVGVERQSFREKIAVFQTDGKGLLQKSLSDEEKSKSLKRLNDFLTKKENERNEAAAAAAVITTTTAIASSSLATVSYAGAGDDESEEEESSNNSDTDEDNDVIRAQSPLPPPLPISQPPDNDENIRNTNFISDIIDSQLPQSNDTKVMDINATMPSIQSHLPMDRTSLTIKLNTTNTNILDENSIIDTPATKCETYLTQTLNTNQQSKIITTSTITDATVNDDTVTMCEPKTIHFKQTNNMPSAILNNFNNVTKEHDNNNQIDNIQQKQEKIGDDDEGGIDSQAKVMEPNCKIATNGKEIIEAEKTNIYRTPSTSSSSSSSSNVVRNRLSQFEALFENEQKRASSWSSKAGHSRTSSNDSRKLRTTKSIDTNNIILNDIIAIKNISNSNVQETNRNNTSTTNLNINVPNADQITAKNNESDLPDIKAIDSKDNNNDFDKENNLSYHKIIKPKRENVNVDAITNNATNNGDNIISKANTIKVATASVEHRPIPLKRNITKEMTDEVIAKTTTISSLPPTPSKRKNKVLFNNDKDSATAESSLEIMNEIPIPQTEIQADTLNKQNGAMTINIQENVKYPVNLNPFGSGDENDNAQDSIVEIRSKLKTIHNKADTSNPFDSSDDEIELLKDTKPKKSAMQMQRQAAQFR